MPVNEKVFYLTNQIYVYKNNPFSCCPYLPKKDVKPFYFLVCDALQIAYCRILEVEDGSSGSGEMLG